MSEACIEITEAARASSSSQQNRAVVAQGSEFCCWILLAIIVFTAERPQPQSSLLSMYLVVTV